jgi:hypothetical protein
MAESKRFGPYKGSDAKPSYQQYEVSEQAQDILNKQLKNYNR